MPQLSLKLLGGLSIFLDARPLTNLVSQKAEVLLAYLCMERREHNREILAALLWENSSQEQGLANLRTLLASLKKHLDPFLQISRQTVAILPEAVLRVDAFDLREGLQRWLPEPARHFDELQSTLGLYQGEFMQGIYPRDSRELEAWISITREQLAQLVLSAHYKLGTSCLDSGHYAQGLPHAQALLRLEPANESHHRLMMNLLARSGQREAALSQYESCIRILDEQLGLPPESETSALAERLRQSAQSSLPSPGTSFVGRQLELAKIAENLRQPECRLLTIIGLGGSGKTRLALQAAHSLQTEFANGSVFAPLHGIDHASYLASAIAEAVQFPLHTDAPAHEQLSRFLHKKELLLVLDNCEHLLEGDSAAVFRQALQTLLKGAPRIRFLLTSRERVGLQNEWLLELDGLDVSAGELAPAYQLFIQRAQAVSASLGQNAEDQAAIYRICQIVQGLPLGIELAAAWSRSLACPQIAAILETNLDLLSSRLHDVPERHRSLRAVFDYVWERLEAPAQTLTARLGVFASSFDLDAAIGIAQASPWLLAELVEKSFLHLENGRYRMIEALQTYALEKLKQTPSLHAQILDEYGSYYFGLLRRFRFTPQKLRAEMDNLRAAWLRAVQQAQCDLIRQASDDFCHLHIQRGMFQEGRQLFQAAIDALGECPTALSGLYASLAYLLNSMALYDQAQFAAEKAIHWAGQTDDPYSLAHAQLQKARNLWRQDQYDLALELLQQVIAQVGEQGAFTDLLAAAWRDHSIINIRKANYAEARKHCSLALQLYRQLGDRHGEGSVLNNLGVVEWYEDANLPGAKAYFEQDLAICRELGNTHGETQALGNLGYVAVALGQTAEAERLYHGTLERHRHAGDRYNEAWTLNSLAELALQQGRYYAMKLFCEEALPISREINSRWLEGSLLVTLGLAYEAMGAYETAAQHIKAGLLAKREIGEMYAVAISAAYLARLWVQLGDFEAADNAIHESLMISKQDENPTMNAETALVAAQMLFASGSPAEARKQLLEAMKHWQEDEHSLQVIAAQSLLAEIALRGSDPQTALDHINIVLGSLHLHPITDTVNTPHLYLVCLQVLAACRDERALPLAREARAFVEARQREIADPILRGLYLSRQAAPLLQFLDTLPKETHA